MSTKAMLFLIIFFLSFSVSKSYGQNKFDSAIGMRLGNPLSIVYKQRMDGQYFLQATAGVRSDRGDYAIKSFTGSYLRHFDLDVERDNGLEFYLGLGFGIDIWKYYKDEYEKYGSFSGDVLGLIGMSYQIKKVPIVLTFEWAPTYRVKGMGSGYDGTFITIGCLLALQAR